MTFDIERRYYCRMTHRLADRGWIEGEWGELETGRRAKFYAIRPAGRKRLAEEKRNWHRVSIAVNHVLAEEL